uniref:Uncharacterized protein n=1 Tax=Ammonifex degensii TaxID=42838 RepID=A0A7C1F3S6_9THEO
MVGLKGVETATGKMAVLRELLPNLACLQTVPERDEGIRTVTRITGLSWEIVRGELDRFLEKGSKQWLNTRKSAKNKHKIEYTANGRRKTEACLLRLLIEQPSLAHQVEAAGGAEIFTDEIHRQVYLAVREAASRGRVDAPFLFSRLGEDEQTAVAALLTEEAPVFSEELAQALIATLQEKKRRDKRQELLLALQMAEKTGDEDRVQALLRELAELFRHRKEGC